MRTARSPRVVSALAVLGLILISAVMVLVLNASSLVNPVAPPSGSPPNSPGGPVGLLVLQLVSNTNESNPISNPTPGQIPIAGLAITVSLVTNSSSRTPFTQRTVLTTAKNGIASRELPIGSYLVTFPVEALDVKIPVRVSVGNQTTVNVAVSGTAYQLLYSEESNLVPTAIGIQSTMYAEVGASSPVANDSEPVILKMHEGLVAGLLVNATVVSQEPPAQGKQWLDMGTTSLIDPVNVTSIDLTTWRYTSSVTVAPEGLSGQPAPGSPGTVAAFG